MSYSYRRWQWNEPGTGWTLCLFDDEWQIAGWAADNYDLTLSSQRTAVAQRIGRSKFHQVGIALLPHFAGCLRDVSNLYVGPFPSSREQLVGFIDKLLPLERTAFLVDLLDHESGEYPGDDMVVPTLLDVGVPKHRVALYTYGGAGSDSPVECIIKREVVKEDGASLSAWWERVIDSIDYAFFELWTRKHGKGHDPSTIAAVLKDDEFRSFVDELALRDKYGVWKWIGEVLQTGVSLLEKQYAYLCGKAFLRFGQDDASCFAAIRGLAHGIGATLPTPRQIAVTEADIPDDFRNDLDNVLFCGGCLAGGPRFEVVARGLREWLTVLESDGKGMGRLQSIAVDFSDEGTIMTLEFSEALPRSIFDGTGKGSVTAGWRELRGATATSILEPSKDGREVRILFPAKQLVGA